MNRRIRRGISCAVLVFPPATPVTVAVDGRRLADYVRAELSGGRVYVPLSLLRELVDRMWIEDGGVVVERDGRRARIPFILRFDGAPDVAKVAIGPALRALGDRVCYRPATQTLEIRTPAAAPVASAVPSTAVPVAPRAVFTPAAPVTPRPVWSGSPLPRRTPLPVPPRSTTVRRRAG